MICVFQEGDACIPVRFLHLQKKTPDISAGAAFLKDYALTDRKTTDGRNLLCSLQPADPSPRAIFDC